MMCEYALLTANVSGDWGERLETRYLNSAERQI